MCSHNLEKNLPAHSSLSGVTAQKLVWSTTSPALSPKYYDAIFACDVVYDLSILPPLLATASSCLKPGKSFVLSHIPRANTNEDRAVGTEEEIKAKIHEEAKRWELQLDGEWRLSSGEQEGSILLLKKI